MASSASGQDDPNRALWLAIRAGKMEPSCPLGTTRCIPQAKLPRKPYNKSFIDQVCSVKMAGYWPRSFFASLWTSTSSRSINTQKKNSANIQPSWPHTWSITHTYRTFSAPKSTTLFIAQKIVEKTPLPIQCCLFVPPDHSNCDTILLGGGRLNGQAKKEKRDNSDEIGS